ncbi:GNAT family N-acetyltransferase [Pseudorhodoferax sp.]|uniref:GNAT family N-acetyltransferase n=1 Tax=Pseudorhodoferax sp. TaxID=1993553 RepID=UPI002DD61BA1|nr:GNAT family N-acetyltransferase [Pseudorhodoferax sp.]
MNTAAPAASGLDADALSRIEDAGLNASAPPQQLWLDGWLLRLSPGKAKRARCINAVAAGRLPVAQKLAQAAQAYREAGLPLVVRITPFSQPADLDPQLAALGLHRFDDTRVMVRTLGPPQADTVSRPPWPDGCRLETADASRYAEAVGALRGSPAAQRLAHAERLALSPVPYQGWLLCRGTEVLACGQGAREGDRVGLYDVFTAPAARNQGLAQALCTEILRRAAHDGARTAYLQVDAANTAARAAYRRLGFVDGYAYHYRSPDPAAA